MTPAVLDRVMVECSAIGFQALITSLLGLACFLLWRHQRQPYFLTWALAWTLYACRLASMSTYLVHQDVVWLAVHQSLAGLVSLLLLLAALQFSSNVRWKRAYVGLGVVAVLWGWAAIYGIHSTVAAGVVSRLLLSAVTIGTGFAFWRFRDRMRSNATRTLAWTFWLWGLYHLCYPLVPPFEGAVLYGMFVDVLFIVVVAMGTLFLVLGEERDKLATRTGQLEQLTRLLVSRQEDERRRVARELHDEAGQLLSVVKMELDLDNRAEASALVGKVLAKVRELSNLLRPAELDDLGLLPALRSLVDDFARRTRIETTLETVGSARTFGPDIEVAIYRVVQEALTNITRHADAHRAQVRLEVEPREVRLRVEDDGRGPDGDVTPHTGLLFMRERVGELGGALEAGPAPAVAGGEPHRGFLIRASIPLPAGT